MRIPPDDESYARLPPRMTSHMPGCPPSPAAVPQRYAPVPATAPDTAPDTDDGHAHSAAAGTHGHPLRACKHACGIFWQQPKGGAKRWGAGKEKRHSEKSPNGM